MLVKSENYMTIQGWMRTDLDLSGTELMVYAIIYGYTQSAQGKFTGSRQYLADWTGASVRTIQNVLNKLTDDGLLTKTTTEPTSGVTVCEYVANFTPRENPARGPVKILHGASENSALYNIADTKEDNQDSISKEILGEQDEVSPLDDDVASKMYSKEDFLGSRKKSTSKPKKLNLYQQCVIAIEQFTDDAILQELLKSYLQLRLKMADKSHIYAVAQWNKMMEKLYNIDHDNYKQREIVKTAIERGWASFFPVEDKKRTNYHNTGDTDASGNKSVRSNKIREEEYDDEPDQVM